MVSVAARFIALRRALVIVSVVPAMLVKQKSRRLLLGGFLALVATPSMMSPYHAAAPQLGN